MKLHSPFQFKNGTQVKNRIWLAPMTNCQSNADGSLGQDELHWLTKNATGGFGVISTCASHVSTAAQAWPNQLGCFSDQLLPGLTQLTHVLSAYHTCNILQIFHGGVRCPRALTGLQPMSASEFVLDIPNFEKPRAMTEAEIKSVVADFANAAYRAYSAGFNGVEIHGANGYLITQFISKDTNHRNDNYGGTLANRARFAREIIRACRKQVPKTFLIGIRLSPENAGLQTGLDLDENVELAQWLVEDGIDFLHLSLSGLFFPSRKYPQMTKTVPEFFRDKLISDFPLIAGGGIFTAQAGEKALDTGIDFVSLGSIAIGNTDWPNHAEEKNYQPISPPYSVEFLKSQGISAKFLEYIRSLKMKKLLEEHVN